VLHRVASDEVWHHYEGGDVELSLLDPDGRWEVVRLGAGSERQAVVPAGVWQAARNVGTAAALCGCTVAPGFEFADFEIAARDPLIAAFPAHADRIAALTR
jgi:predicted cupin superfamily sugar epimerase